MAEELVLLGYGDRGDPVVAGVGLDFGLAGAVLVELALAGRVEVADGMLTVVDRAPTGDPVLDATLARIAEREPPRTPKDWVGDLRTGLREQILGRLVGAGVLRREPGRVLWVFPATRYPSASGEQPPAEVEIRRRLLDAIEGDGPVDERAAALCALVRASRLEQEVFGDLPKDRVAARLTEIGTGDWAAESVKRAVAELDAALVAALTVVAVITAAG
ncbi:hypothetical protein GCM10023322_36010 [Rugosimonospora acidiphila]|uniref:Golgi phosphoprotein 3 (GPP34) n=1 Tax=Rugosimonospora acidiphila TaxID=556531 RepID=A0ABP9RVX7_9ACTN